ncbi:hypothetical protein EVAR_31893_1 [Eumeta japonica]|uniref:Uncharacterized protein n=1 Tax=Eumeta variegata TaxID=151549 RepID=A0A4C1WWU0_EUMVA|nr:hypothetical protein EVAR_31893_1 [Eumeta japonica]
MQRLDLSVTQTNEVAGAVLAHTGSNKRSKRNTIHSSHIHFNPLPLCKRKELASNKKICLTGRWLTTVLAVRYAAAPRPREIKISLAN